MSKRRFVGVMLAALAVVLAGAALASNMGFKLNYTLIAAGNPVPVPENTVNPNSQDGTNELALPDFRQTGLGTAKQLLTDVGTAAGSISKFRPDRRRELPRQGQRRRERRLLTISLLIRGGAD